MFSDVAVALVGVFAAVKGEQDEGGGINGVGDLVLDAGFELVGGVFEASGVN